MLSARTRLPALLTALVAALLAITSAFADDWQLTGSSVRVKTVAVIDVKVYAISHFVKGAPPAKSKQAVIDADQGKKFVWTMKRDVDKDKIVGALRDAFKMNGYGDGGKIDKFVGAFGGELKENANVSIVYDADKKETTATTPSGTATVGGVEFMKAVWSIWFGKIDQPKLGDELISKL
jgi:hypothetical protein